MSKVPAKPASNSVQSGMDALHATSPGERLRRAREARRFEIPEMAERLHLSKGVVRALEADDYRMMPGPTFVRGYLRSYARVLEIDGEDLVRTYEAITGCNQPVKVEPVNAPMLDGPKRGQRMVTLGLVLLVMLGAGFWLTLGGGQQAKNDAPGVELASNAAPEVASTTRAAQETDTDIVANVEASNESLDGDAVRDESGSTLASESAPGLDASPDAVVPDGIVPDAIAPGAMAPAGGAPADSNRPAESAPVPAPEPVQSSSQAAPVPAPVVASVAAGAGAAEATTVAASTPTDGSGLINFRFQGDCWVEVRDRSSGRLVFSGLKRAGEEVNLPVKAPVHVKLGNGDMVAVKYNHQPVTVTTRPGSKVVRLALGE